MKPSDMCKEKGIRGLKELSEIEGVSVSTLMTWHREKRQLFLSAITRAVESKKISLGIATNAPGGAEP